MQSTRSNRMNPTKVNLWFDLALFAAILFSPAVAFTGLAIHEWLGIGLAAATLGAVALSWVHRRLRPRRRPAPALASSSQ